MDQIVKYTPTLNCLLQEYLSLFSALQTKTIMNLVISWMPNKPCKGL